MSKIGHSQNCLEDIFDEYTPQLLNKSYCVQLQYKVKKRNRILIFVRISHQNAYYAVMKSAMFVSEKEDLDFLRAYLAGLVLTLGIFSMWLLFLWMLIDSEHLSQRVPGQTFDNRYTL